MRILGLIPARGGSKGVPRKNIKLLCGKPLIQYTFESALNSQALDSIIVSTEDAEIAQIALDLGASVPFLRPSNLASDQSPTIDSVVYTLEECQKRGDYYDAVCLLQPTNPLRTSRTIELAIEKFIVSSADSLISVREVPHEFNPHWTFEVEANTDHLRIATGESKIISRRQELPKTYFRDGEIYITKSEVVLDQKSLYGSSISYYSLEGEPHVNIDTIEDWKKAERILCVE